MKKWIKVKDKLPKNNEYVLACDVSDIFILKFHQTTDRRHKKREGYFGSSNFEENFGEITHWIPLPELPEEEEDECK